MGYYYASHIIMNFPPTLDFVEIKNRVFIILQLRVTIDEKMIYLSSR